MHGVRAPPAPSRPTGLCLTARLPCACIVYVGCMHTHRSYICHAHVICTACVCAASPLHIHLRISCIGHPPILHELYTSCIGHACIMHVTHMYHTYIRHTDQTTYIWHAYIPHIPCMPCIYHTSVMHRPCTGHRHIIHISPLTTLNHP